MTNKFALQLPEIILCLKEDKIVAYLCREQKQYDRVRKMLDAALEKEGENKSLADNFFCHLESDVLGIDPILLATH